MYSWVSTTKQCSAFTVYWTSNIKMTLFSYWIGKLQKLSKSFCYPGSFIIEKLKHLRLFHVRGPQTGKAHVQENPQASNQSELHQPTNNPLTFLSLWSANPLLLLANSASIKRDLSNKLDKVTTAINNLNPSIVAIIEAWQTEPDTVNINNYQFFYNLRTTMTGGGMGMFVQESLRPTPI